MRIFMISNETFLYDTYALIELLNKNKYYENYADKDIVINEFIYAEFCYQMHVLNVVNPQQYLDEVKPAVIKPTLETIKKAMDFRYKNKKNKMSMTDCVSYIMAQELEIKFLTGDKEFENLENVEFVKK